MMLGNVFDEHCPVGHKSDPEHALYLLVRR
jgi:hypothetical protein